MCATRNKHMLHIPRAITLTADGIICMPTHETFRMFIIIKIFLWISSGNIHPEENATLNFQYISCRSMYEY
jgi:hypothetical protein